MLKRPVYLCLFSLWLSDLSAAGLTAAAPAEQQALSVPSGLDLAPRWRALLFYVPRWGGRESSLVRDPGFFLAANGDHDAAAELTATVAAMLAPVGADPNAHAICRFPARLAWLRDVIRLPTLPQPHCSAQEDWLKERKAESASLVFSSYYLNNPASLFGHTFLLLHAKAASTSQVLLDEAVNFAATPTTTNPLAYPYLGLTGGFAGHMFLMPYYLKIQEYSNAERRDLWEYPLRLTQTEVRSLLLSLWELGDFPVPYYYVDENCSYVMLALLDAVRPSLHLAAKFRVFVTPADTVRAAADAGLLATPAFRPSSRARYLARMAGLSAEEQDQVKAVFAADTALPALSAPVLDAALDWASYDEKLAGSKQAVIYQKRQTQLLDARAKLAQSEEFIVAPPSYQRPDLGPRSALLNLAAGVDAKARAFEELTWRPTLHDLTAPSVGYSEALQLELLRLTARRTGTRLLLQNLRLFDALSTPSVEPMLLPPAWHFGLGLEREPFSGEGLRSYFEGGIGLAYSLDSVHGMPPLFQVYALPLLAAGWSPSLRGHGFLAPGFLAGFGAERELGLPLRLTGSLRVAKAYSSAGEQRLERRLRLTLAAAVGADGECGFYAERYDPLFALRAEVGVNFGRYF